MFIVEHESGRFTREKIGEFNTIEEARIAIKDYAKDNYDESSLPPFWREWDNDTNIKCIDIGVSGWFYITKV